MLCGRCVRLIGVPVDEVDLTRRTGRRDRIVLNEERRTVLCLADSRRHGRWRFAPFAPPFRHAPRFAISLARLLGLGLFVCGPMRIEQPVQQDFGDDHEDRGVRVHATIAGHEADLLAPKAPAFGRRLQLGELLLGERDQRRRVVDRLTGVQRLIRRRFGDQRLPRPRRRTHHHAVVGIKPRQQRLLLNGVRRIWQCVEIVQSQFITSDVLGGR